jgi:hypothetical protein
MENLLYESGDLKLVLPSLSATENLQILLFFRILISNFAFWRSFASKLFFFKCFFYKKTLVPNLSLAWLTTSRVQSFLASLLLLPTSLGLALYSWGWRLVVIPCKRS